MRDPEAPGHGLYRIIGPGRADLPYTLLEAAEAWQVGDASLVRSAEVIVGESLAQLSRLPPDHFECCVTSPPYWMLRDYQHADQIGLEDHPFHYIERLVGMFAQVRRVLKPTGLLFLNIGDQYVTRRAIKPDGKRGMTRNILLGQNTQPSWREASARGLTTSPARLRDFGKEGDLMLLPYELAKALRSDGWYLRNQITWVKSHTFYPVTDRPRPMTELVFLLTKIGRGYCYEHLRACDTDVWYFTPARGTAEHSAMMPLALAERCIEIGAPRGGRVLDPFGGTGTTPKAAQRLDHSATVIELNPQYIAEALA